MRMISIAGNLLLGWEIMSKQPGALPILEGGAAQPPVGCFKLFDLRSMR